MMNNKMVVSIKCVACSAITTVLMLYSPKLATVMVDNCSVLTMLLRKLLDTTFLSSFVGVSYFSMLLQV